MRASVPWSWYLGSASRISTAALDAGARLELPGDLGHLRVQVGHLTLAPGVGLLEVDRGAQEVARLELVALPPAGVRLGGMGRAAPARASRQSRRMPLTLPARRPRARLAALPSRGPSLVSGVGDQAGEVAVLGSQVARLLGAGRHLAGRSDQPALARREERLAVLLERVGDARHPRRDGAPLGLGARRHEVDDVADRLERRGDDVERHLVEAGGVAVLGDPESLGHRRHGDPVDVVDRGRVGQLVEDGAAQVARGPRMPAGERSSSSSSRPGTPR